MLWHKWSGQTNYVEHKWSPWITYAQTIYALTGLTLAKIVYEISKSFDFIEIKMISSDLDNDFRLQKSIKCMGSLTQNVTLGTH